MKETPTFPDLCKLVTHDETIYRDGDRDAVPPLRMLAVAAVLRNTWVGRGYVADLSPEIAHIAPILGKGAGALVAIIAAISAFGTCNALLLLSAEVGRSAGGPSTSSPS